MVTAQLESLKLVREILKEEFVEIELERLESHEDLALGVCDVRAWLKPSPAGVAGTPDKPQILEGRGVGVVDAIYAALVSRFRVEYPSLNTIHFVRFQIEGRFTDSSVRGGADGIGEVRLGVRNSAGREFEFAASSRSITAGAVRAVASCVAYFVNSERAYIVTYRALKDAQERRRDDLVQSYTARLVELVKNTSYTDVIKSIRE